MKQRLLAVAMLLSGGALLGIIAFPLIAGENDRPAPQSAKMSGVVHDVHCLMSGEHPSGDRVKCTAECLRAGVPAVLQTPDSIVLLGKGMKGAGELLAPMACKDVEVTGRLYEMHGVRYLDIQEITVAEHLEGIGDRDEDEDDE